MKNNEETVDVPADVKAKMDAKIAKRTARALARGKWILLRLLLMLPGALWCGYVLKTLWFWLLVPYGVPALSLGTAIGLDVIGSLLIFAFGVTGNKPRRGSNSVKHQKAALILRFLYPLICLGIGRVGLFFM